MVLICWSFLNEWIKIHPYNIYRAYGSLLLHRLLIIVVLRTIKFYSNGLKSVENKRSKTYKYCRNDSSNKEIVSNNHNSKNINQRRFLAPIEVKILLLFSLKSKRL